MSHSGPEKTPEIQRADPAARKRALWIAALGIAVASTLALSLSAYETEITRWLASFLSQKLAQPELLLLVFFVAVLPVIGVSVYIWFQGARIVKAQRLPYPGQKVIKDTPVISGKQAVQRGRIIQAIAAVMVLLSLVIPFLPTLFMLSVSRGP